MRKKELLNENNSLCEEIQKYRMEIVRLNKLLKEKNLQIETMTAQIEELKLQKETALKPEIKDVSKNSDATIDGDTEQITAENGVVFTECETKLDDATELGAGVIGELVVASAEYSNKLTENNNVYNKELLNLILGRTEVAKAEILKIVSSDCGMDEKTAMANTVKSETLEYFESVMAQIK